jgi:DNA sulfur modification protein DndD
MKCKILEDAIFRDLNQIMHKANFIGGVKSDILPDGDGLKITLINQDGTIRPKQSGLSEGEKQLYISCLIKAILSLSIQELPIFIDTPLARLDVEHIEKVLKDYYPNLANQVILLATNNEIPPSRFKLMQSNVAQTYLLENKRNSTKFKQGYFQSYEN